MQVGLCSGRKMVIVVVVVVVAVIWCVVLRGDS